MKDYVETAVFLEYVAERGYKAEPLLNTTEVGMTGVPLRVVGYTLLGPRGNQTIVPKDADGRLARCHARLWADGVDYATARLAKKRKS